MSAPHPMLDAFLKGRFSAFLVSTVALFMVVPLVPASRQFVDKLFAIVVLVVLASCLRAISNSRKFFVIMLVFTVLNLGIGAFELFFDGEPYLFNAIVLVVRALYFGVVFLSIMRYVLDDSAITSDKISGAISAYVVMGLVWSFVYALFLHNDPESFRFPAEMMAKDELNSTWAMIYFSFTTLTTLGYGDITPLSPKVQSYAIVEAASGQIFLAVIIARLIALRISSGPANTPTN